MNEDTDYCGMLDETFADGLDLEIIKYTALEKSWMEAKHSFEREHVTQYIIRHPEIFKIQKFNSPIGNFGNNRWTVDEPEDFELVKNIYEHFDKTQIGMNFNYKDILNYLQKNPEVMKINQKYKRNEGLIKSINEDYIMC